MAGMWLGVHNTDTGLDLSPAWLIENRWGLGTPSPRGSAENRNTPITGCWDSQEAGASLSASNLNLGRSSEHSRLPPLRKEKFMRYQAVFLSNSVAFAALGTFTSD